jgi:hypothetical protein
MRRIALFVSFAAFALLAFASLEPLAGVSAQDATPQPSKQFIGLPEGVVAWEVGDFTQIPSTYQLQMQPGTALPVSNGPELSLVYVESGEVVLKPQGELAISHREAGQSPEIIPADQDYTAHAGDYFVAGASAQTEIRNESAQVASLQVAMMDPLHPIIVDTNQTPG